MSRFVPCQGKTACRDDGVRCLTCGRTLEEIGRLRDALDGLADLAITYGYENVAEYRAYVAQKLENMIVYRRQQGADDAA
jgi:hypothetical protein